MRVFYCGVLGPRDTSTHRKDAIGRLGHDVCEFNFEPYYKRGGPLLRRIRQRTLWGRSVRKLNQDLLLFASHHRPEVAWLDKPLYVWPETIRQLRRMGVFTIHFTIDNPFGSREDPGWRHIVEAIPEYNLHLVQREINLSDYHSAGAQKVMLMRTAYEPTIHFPPHSDWSDAEQTNDVVFIGAPYDERPRFLTDLWKIHGIKTKIWGAPSWESVLPSEPRQAMWQGHELWNADYRQAIWHSRICLAFVTHSNHDDVAHKSFEIAASGGFLLAEDTPAHRHVFKDGEEAVFFKSVDDCAAMIRKYLSDSNARMRVAKAACSRALESGYSNDARIAPILDYARVQMNTNATFVHTTHGQ